MSNPKYLFILICIPIVAAFVCVTVLSIITRSKDDPPNFDERQQIGRGKANGYGYATLVLSLGAYLLYDYIAEKPVLNTPIGVILCVIVSAMVYGVVCISKDSYVTLQDSRRNLVSQIILGFLNGVLYVSIGILSIINGSIIKDGVLRFPVIIMALGVAYIVKNCALAIHAIIHKKEAAQEYGEDE